MGCLLELITLPFKVILAPFKLLQRSVEEPRKMVDRTLGRTKCPRCRSANVMKAGGKWHCNDCGRNFR